MLGNFSFGDYFKELAIPFAWELLTSSESEGGFGFPESRLWVTVYTDDDEAAKLWHDHVGVPEDRIQRRGLADNYWHMGVPGPGRALLGDLLRPRARVRPRGRAGGR